MKDFPSCFGENGVQVADFSSSNTSKATQSVVTCVYQCDFFGKSCLITVSWSKNLMGQGFSVEIDDYTHQSLCKVDIRPWLLSKKKGSKNLEVDSCKINIYWDLSSAKFGSGPEPLQGFYVCIVLEKQMILLLGDMRKEAFKKTGAIRALTRTSFISKKEHVFGKRVFSTKVQFYNIFHDLVIECDTSGPIEPCLVIQLDCKPVMKVKRLRWKFRGNCTILVDGLAVEVFWDVHNLLFGASPGNAVFMFKTRDSTEKLWESQSVYDSNTLDWSWSERFRDTQLQNLDFSLVLYVWKTE